MFLIVFIILLQSSNLIVKAVDNVHTIPKIYHNNHVGLEENFTLQANGVYEAVFNTHIKTKRSTTAKTLSSWKKTGSAMEKINGFAVINFLTMKNVVDVCLFAHNLVGEGQQLLAAAIVSADKELYLEISKLQGKDMQWKSLKRLRTNAMKISNHQVPEGTILFVAKRFSNKTQDILISLMLDDNLHLKKLQNFHYNLISNIVTKSFVHDVFLIFTHTEKNGVVNCVIFKWKGAHFDLIQSFTTMKAKLSMFIVKSHLYLGVAKYTDEYGFKRASSVIYRYNSDSDLFNPYQYVPSIGAVFIHFFEIANRFSKESFLLIANSNIKSNNEESVTMVHKFHNGFFAPFQSIVVSGLVKWLPIEAGASKLVLFGSTTHSTLVYQYNGWKFERLELSPKNLDAFDYPEFRLKKISFLNQTLIASIATQKDGQLKLFKPVFTKENHMENYNKHVKKWCTQTLTAVSNVNLIDIRNKMKRLYSNNYGEYVRFEDSFVQEVATKKLLLNGKLLIDNNLVQNVNEIAGVLKAQLGIITKILNNLSSFVKKTDFKEILTLSADKVIIKGFDNMFNETQVQILNGVKFKEFQENIFTMKSRSTDILIENMNVSHITFNNINQQSVRDFNVLVNKFMKKNGLIVDGNLYADKGIEVRGNINSVKFSDTSLILHGREQKLKGNLSLYQLEVEKLKSTFINDLTQEEILSLILSLNISLTSDLNYNTLKVHDLIGKGLFGVFEINSLYKNALRRKGSQNISGKVYVTNSNCTKFESPMQESIVISNNAPKIIFRNEVQFAKIAARALFVQEYLNSIPVKDGNLSVLLLNSKERQYVYGVNNFDNVKVLGEIHLNKELKSNLMKNQGPYKIFEYPLEVNGDFLLQGNVTINGYLAAENLISHNNSVTDILGRAMKLCDETIEIPVAMNVPIKVQNVNFDTINGIGSEDLVMLSGNNDIVNFGTKIFKNVKILDQCSGISVLNNVDLETFYSQVMYTNIDQDISANITFDHLTLNRIYANQTIVGDTPLSNLITYSGDHVAKISLVVENDVYVDMKLKSKSTTVKGTISELSLDDILLDTVYKGMKRYKIKSNKFFTQPLLIETLLAENKFLSLNAKEVIKALNWEKTITIPHSMSVTDVLYAHNIIFDQTVDGIDVNDFGRSWLLYEHNQTFTEEQTLNVVHLLQDINVYEDKINGLSSDFFSGIIKLDDDIELDTLEVQDLKAPSVYQSLDYLNNVKISDILLKNSDVQTIHGSYTFDYGLMVSGDIQFKSFFGSDVKHILDFLKPAAECQRKLYVQGKASFNTEPIVEYINSADINALKANVWYLNQDVTMTYPLSFRNMVFDENIEVKGLVNGVDMKKVALSYLSKTKDQNISGNTHLCSASAPIVSASVAKLDLAVLPALGDTIKKFTERLLYTRGSTEWSSRISNVNFEAIDCLDLYVEGKINNLNYNEDVMLYNTNWNDVTAHKEFGNVNVNYLNFKPDSTLNRVDVNSWQKNAVYKNVTSQQITGHKIIPSCYMPGLRLNTLNNLKIPEEVLLHYGKQVIRGKKKFNVNENVVGFHNMTIYGNLNSFPSENIKHLIYKYNQNISIPSPKFFKNTIDAQNIVVDKKDQSLIFVEEALSEKSLDTTNTDIVLKRLQKSISYLEENLQNMLYTEPGDMMFIQQISGELTPVATSMTQYNLVLIERRSNGCSLQGLFWNGHSFSTDNALTLWETNSITNAWTLDKNTIVASTETVTSLIRHPGTIRVELLFETPIKQAIPIYLDHKDYILVLYNDGKIVIRDAEKLTVFTSVEAADHVDEIGVVTVNNYPRIVTMSATQETAKFTVWHWSATQASFMAHQTWEVDQHPSAMATCGAYLSISLKEGINVYKLEQSQGYLNQFQKLQYPCDDLACLNAGSDVMLGCIKQKDDHTEFNLFNYKGVLGFHKEFVARVPYEISSLYFYKLQSQNLILLKSNNYLSVYKFIYN